MMQQPNIFQWLWNDAPILIPVLVLGKAGEIGIIFGIVHRSHGGTDRRCYSLRLFAWGLLAGGLVGVIGLARGEESLLIFSAGIGSFVGSGIGALIDFSQCLLDRFDPVCRIRLSR